MASKRPMPLRWWAIACYVAGGFIMYQAYVGGRAEEAPPYSIYRDSADPYWRVIATGRSGDWFDLKNSQRVSEGTTAIRARLGGTTLIFLRRNSKVDLERYPAEFIQFHMDNHSLNEGGLRIALQTGWKMFSPTDGLLVTGDYAVSTNTVSGFVVVRVPIDAFGRGIREFHGVRLTAPSAPADMDFYLDNIEFVPGHGIEGGDAGTNAVPSAGMRERADGAHAPNPDAPAMRRGGLFLPVLLGGAGAVLFAVRKRHLAGSSPATCLENLIYLCMMLAGIALGLRSLWGKLVG